MSIQPIGTRLLVTSRGIKEETGDIVVPGKFLRDSNICTTELDQRVIVRDHSGHDVGEHRRIVDRDDLLAVEVGGQWAPTGKNVILRKCIDPDEGEIITSLSVRKTKFAEVVAAGPDSVLKDYIGWLAYVDDITYHIQKIEDTEDDWVATEKSILMAVEPEE